MGMETSLPVSIKSPEKSYEEILNEIEEVIDDPEKVKSFIVNRLSELSKVSNPTEIGAMTNTFYSGFINPKTKIRRSYTVDPFTLNDESVYADLFSALKKFRESPAWKDQPLRAMIPFVVQHTVADYFGNLVSDSRTENDNRKFYMDNSYDESPDISIGNLKGMGFAVCAEKASLSQNLTSFLGLESYLVNSNTCQLIPDGDSGGHAFNIWKTTKGYFIFDPANPQLTLEEGTQKVLTYAPAVYPISEETLVSMKNGGTGKVQHVDVISGVDGNLVEKKVSERIYGGSKA